MLSIIKEGTPSFQFISIAFYLQSRLYKSYDEAGRVAQRVNSCFLDLSIGAGCFSSRYLGQELDRNKEHIWDHEERTLQEVISIICFSLSILNFT